jgi:hypothetical protein
LTEYKVRRENQVDKYEEQGENYSLTEYKKPERYCNWADKVRGTRRELA